MLAQPGPAEPSEGTDAEKVVQQLSAPELSVRKKAASDLWQLGEKAKPALERARNSEDAETRRIAKKILRDFEFGILPNVPLPQRKLLADFRDGDATVRSKVLSTLCRQEAFDLINRLLRAEPEPNLLWAQLKGSPDLTKKLVKDKGLGWLIDRMRGAAKGVLFEFVQALYSDAQYRKALVEQELIPDLIALYNEFPVEQRTFVIAILRCQDVFASLAQEGRASRLLTYAVEEADPVDGRKIGKALAMIGPVAKQLLAENRLDDLVELASKEPDPVEQARVTATLCGNPDIVAELIRSKQTPLLLSFQREDWTDIQRLEFARLLVLSPAAIRYCIESGNLDSLVQLAKRSKPSNERTRLILVMLGSSNTIDSLIDANEFLGLFDIVCETDSVLSSFCAGLLNNNKAIDVLLKHDRVDDVLRLIAEDSNIHSKLKAVRGIASSRMIDTLSERNEIHRLYDLIGQEDDVQHQRMLFSGLASLRRLDGPQAQAGNLSALLNLIGSQKDESLRSIWLKQVLSQSNTVAAIANTDSAKAVLRLIRSIKDVRMRGTLAYALLNPRDSRLRPQIAQSCASEVFQMAIGESDLRLRATYINALARSLSKQSMLETADISGLMRSIGADPSGADVVRALTSTSTWVAAMRKSSALDELYKICSESPHKSLLLNRLMESRYAVEALDLETQILPWLEERASDPDVLDRVVNVSHLRELGIRHGYLDTMIKHVRNSNDKPDRKRSRLMSFMLLEPAIVQLTKQGRAGEILATIREESDPAARSRLISTLSSRSSGLELLVRELNIGQLHELTKSIDQQYRNRLEEQLFLSTAALEKWSQAGRFMQLSDHVMSQSPEKIDKFLTALLGCSGDVFADKQAITRTLSMLEKLGVSRRARYYDWLCDDPSVRWQLFKNGQAQHMLDIARKSSDSQGHEQQILFSTSGLVAYLVYQGRYDDAEKLLQNYANGQEGWSRLATLYLQRGVLAQRIAAYKNSGPQDARLSFLLRCDGQHENAGRRTDKANQMTMAKQIYKDGHLWPLATQRHASLVAKQQKGKNYKNMGIAIWEGQLAVYQRNAGQMAASERTLDRLREAARNSTNNIERRQLAISLLVNGHLND